MQQHRFLVVIGLSLVAACAGSGSATSTTSSSSGGGTSSSAAAGNSSSSMFLQACDAVTVAELNAATGKTFAMGIATASGETSQCGWDQVTDPNNEGGMGVTLYSTSGRTAYTNTANALGDEVAVTGLGDEAFYSPSTHAFMVRKGEAAFDISFSFLNPTQAMAEEIGRHIVGRL